MNARSRWQMLAMLAVAVGLAVSLSGLVGCSDGGPVEDSGGFDVPVPNDAAYLAPLPESGATIQPASLTTQQALQALVDLLLADEWPTAGQIQALEDDFVALVTANPADGGAQFGLVVTTLLTLSDESLASVGMDPESVMGMLDGLLGDTTFAAVQAAAPATAAADLARMAADGDTGDMAAEDLWDMMDVALGWLGDEEPASGILGRLAVAASCEDALATVTIDGEPYDLMPWMPQTMLASAQLIRGALLIATAYDLTDNGWDWGPYLDGESSESGGESGAFAESLGDLDANGDGILTINEYLPGDPFGTLRTDGAARLEEADRSLASASTWMKTAISGMSADEQLASESVEVDWDTLTDVVDVADSLRTGAVTISLDVAMESDGECVIVPMEFSVSLESLLAGEITDVKDLLPSLVSDGEGGWLPATLPDSTFGGLFPSGFPISLLAASDMRPTAIGGIALPADTEWDPCG